MLNNYFFFFFFLIILCSLAVVVSHNPVQSVYFLILVFVFSAILFLILGAEFLAILVIIIYVGAISILFLFVVMMLNLRIMELYSTFYNYLPIGSFIGLFFLFVFIYVIYLDLGFFNSNPFLNDNFTTFHSLIYYRGNVSYLGWILYTYCNHFVLISSLILLVSMIGSIILTVDFEYRAKKNNKVYDNVRRDITTVSFWNTKSKSKF